MGAASGPKPPHPDVPEGLQLQILQGRVGVELLGNNNIAIAASYDGGCESSYPDRGPWVAKSLSIVQYRYMNTTISHRVL